MLGVLSKNGRVYLKICTWLAQATKRLFLKHVFYFIIEHVIDGKLIKRPRFNPYIIYKRYIEREDKL